MYGINQGLAVVGALPVIGIFAKDAAATKLLATATIETLKMLDDVGSAIGFATSQAGADELQYYHEKTQKDNK